MSGRLSGKRALITGAAQGLGLAMARLFAAQGARVAMTDIQADAVKKAAQDIDGAVAYAHDVTSEADWVRVLDAALADLGGLNILVNNAGIGFNKSVVDTSFDDWRRMHAIDLDSVFLGCKHAIPRMEPHGDGAIVNISSIAGIIAGHNMAAYNSAKAAVRHLSKSVALHCARVAKKGGPLIRSNSIHPVFTMTPMLDDMKSAGGEAVFDKLRAQVPTGRLGEPDDVAYAALFLASDESKMITGAELKIDGGISAM